MFNLSMEPIFNDWPLGFDNVNSNEAAPAQAGPDLIFLGGDLSYAGIGATNFDVGPLLLAGGEHHDQASDERLRRQPRRLQRAGLPRLRPPLSAPARGGHAPLAFLGFSL